MLAFRQTKYLPTYLNGSHFGTYLFTYLIYLVLLGILPFDRNLFQEILGSPTPMMPYRFIKPCVLF